MRPEITYAPRFTEGERNLLALPSRLRNLEPFARLAIVPAFVRMLQRHWESKGAAFGRPWAAWTPSTLAARIRKGNASQGILLDSGHLFRAIFRAALRPNIVQKTPTGVRVGFDFGSVVTSSGAGPDFDQTAVFHQFGTRFMPARQPIPDPLPRSFRAEVRSLFRDFILTGRARGAGGQFVSFAGGAR